MTDLIQTYSEVTKLGLLSNIIEYSDEYAFSCDAEDCDTCPCYNLGTGYCKLIELFRGTSLSMEDFERKHIYPILLKSNPELFL